TATDASGSSTTCSFDVVVRDVTAPSITCPADTVMVPANSCGAIVIFTMAMATDAGDHDKHVICSDTSGTLCTGITTVTCAVLDDAGNLAQCDFTITIQDTITPVFPMGCPADIMVVSASGNCGANPTWQAPQATDNCDPDVSL